MDASVLTSSSAHLGGWLVASEVTSMHQLSSRTSINACTSSGQVRGVRIHASADLTVIQAATDESAHSIPHSPRHVTIPPHIRITHTKTDYTNKTNLYT